MNRRSNLLARHLSLGVLLVSLCLQGDVLSLSCYDTCFEDCSSNKCVNHCGASINSLGNVDSPFKLPGFIYVECEEGDSCLLREFEAFDASDEPYLITTPGGCLFDYVRENSTFKYWKRDDTQLFSCDEDFCNVPPLDSCDPDTVPLGTGGTSDESPECKGRPQLGQVQKLFVNSVRGGKQDDDMSERCILDADSEGSFTYKQIMEDSPCFVENNCSASNLPLVDVFMSCTNFGGDTDQPTSSPVLTPAEAPSPTSDSDGTEQDGEEVQDDILIIILGVGIATLLLVVLAVASVVGRMSNRMKKLQREILRSRKSSRSTVDSNFLSNPLARHKDSEESPIGQRSYEAFDGVGSSSRNEPGLNQQSPQSSGEYDSRAGAEPIIYASVVESGRSTRRNGSFDEINRFREFVHGDRDRTEHSSRTQGDRDSNELDYDAIVKVVAASVVSDGTNQGEAERIDVSAFESL